MNRSLPLTAVLAAGLAASVVAAADADNVEEARVPPGHIPSDPGALRQIQLCGPPLAPSPDAVDRTRRNHPDTPLILDAEAIDADGLRALYRLRGDAELRRLDQHLRAENLDLDEAAGRARVPGAFAYSESGLHLWGTAGRFDLDEDRIEVDGAEFRIHPHMHGAARHLVSTGAEQTRLTDLRYSTCPPGDELWWLHAGSLDLDHDAGLGEARHARVELGGIPWFYTPYLQFPIDDRPRTGILPPSFGQSDTDGGYFTLPVYVRLAPNYDLTLQPTYYSRRGVQLGGEFRYLRPSFDGELSAEYLPDDDVYADQLREDGEPEIDAERWAVDWSHRGDLPYGVDYQVDVERVGDVDYLRDFSSDLVGSSDAELESRALARQSRGDHEWEAELQHWQNLRPDDRDDPYRRWPAIGYQHTPGVLPGGVEYRLEGEAVRFELPEGPEAENDEQRPVGRRYHVNPRISWPLQRQAFFIEPGLSLHHTRYDLDRASDAPGDEQLSRTVPIASLDAGIFLERPFQLGNRPFLQTLEPRVYYLYAPYRDQGDYPDFDTSERGNTVAQLFQDNRFSGIDRIGDADQITAAVTTRFLDIVDGREPLRASIGQVYYREDRRVTLDTDPDDPALTRSSSDIFADAELRLPGGLSVRGEYRYDPEREVAAATSLAADWQYQPTPGALVNLGYRVRQEAKDDEDDEPVLETTQDLIEASAVVPIDARWRGVGGWQYSRLERTNLEVVGGVEYRQCCWAVRGVARRFRRGAAREVENTFMLEFELTGLGRLGQDTASFLEDVVPDYDETVF